MHDIVRNTLTSHESVAVDTARNPSKTDDAFRRSGTGSDDDRKYIPSNNMYLSTLIQETLSYRSAV